MDLTGKKVAILIESDFYEHEIWYYHYRFLEAGIDARFVTRLWGQPSSVEASPVGMLARSFGRRQSAS